MRIISGVHKGRRLSAPKKLPIRPTTDMAKEGLFNLLQHRLHLQGLRVLDLFAGSGNISYEFGSRGAELITAVDQHQGCVRFIQKTSEELDLPIEAVRSSAHTFLDKNRRQYDLIFADPPYDFEKNVLLELIATSLTGDTLGAEGYFILEHRPQIDFESHEYFLESRKYGSSVFSFFGKAEE
jgi:16S rRNA (guanine(966)-N(2))-methyltransferase RsmD